MGEMAPETRYTARLREEEEAKNKASRSSKRDITTSIKINKSTYSKCKTSRNRKSKNEKFKSRSRRYRQYDSDTDSSYDTDSVYDTDSPHHIKYSEETRDSEEDLNGDEKATEVESIKIFGGRSSRELKAGASISWSKFDTIIFREGILKYVTFVSLY